MSSSQRYRKMLRVGVPVGAVQQLMDQDEVEQSIQDDVLSLEHIAIQTFKEMENFSTMLRFGVPMVAVLYQIDRFYGPDSIRTHVRSNISTTNLNNTSTNGNIISIGISTQSNDDDDDDGDDDGDDEVQIVAALSLNDRINANQRTAELRGELIDLTGDDSDDDDDEDKENNNGTNK